MLEPYSSMTGGRPFFTDPFDGEIAMLEIKEREQAEKAKRRKLTQDFEAGLIPFNFRCLNGVNVNLSNRTWMDIMVRSIDHVRTNGTALNWDKRKIGNILAIIEETRSTRKHRKFAGPEDLPNLFYNDEVPIYLETLSSLGITLTPRQMETLRESALYDILEEESYYVQ